MNNHSFINQTDNIVSLNKPKRVLKAYANSEGSVQPVRPTKSDQIFSFLNLPQIDHKDSAGSK